MELQDLMDRIIAFRDERDWEQFHTPEQLAAALSIEAAELQELFLWMDTAQVEEALERGEILRNAEREIADVFIYALLFCDAIDAHPGTVIQKKLTENEERYPADLTRGRAEKYTELEDED